MKAIWVMLISLSALALLITPVHAAESVDLAAVPQQLATALGVNLFVGQLISSLLFMALFLFPGMLIAGFYGGEGAVLYTIIIVGLGSSGVCVALGWLPVWIYLMMCLLVAAMYASMARGWVTGRGGGGQ
jgi:hypothetical protein